MTPRATCSRLPYNILLPRAFLIFQGKAAVFLPVRLRIGRTYLLRLRVWIRNAQWSERSDLRVLAHILLSCSKVRILKLRLGQHIVSRSM